MTTKPIYVGVENEFQLMRGSEKVEFLKECGDLLSRYDSPVFEKTKTSIRTKVGSALYADGMEPEVCTHPVRVRKGFAKEATDALYLARKELVDLISVDDSLSLIGYSTHWNITNSLQWAGNPEVMSALAVPYSLFTLNPLSCGINLRSKCDRLELLGDYIPDEDQMRAFFLFYAGTMLNIDANIDGLLPCLEMGRHSAKYGHIVLDGRYTEFELSFDGQRSMSTAQAYLEIIYEFFKDGIAELGTPDDIKNLEDFVYGRKDLEIDRFKKYAFAHHFKEYLDFAYHPKLCVDLDDFKEERELPDNMSKFLGSLANQRYGYGRMPITDLRIPMYKMDWELIDMDVEDSCDPIQGLPLIEIIAEALSVTPDEEKVDLVKEFAWYVSQRDFPGAESILNYEPLSKELRKGLEHAVSTTSFAVGGIVSGELDMQEKISCLEEITYDPNTDDSFTDDPQEIINMSKRGFSWMSVLKKSRSTLDRGGKAILMVLGMCGGLALVGLAYAVASPEEPDPVVRVEFHDNQCRGEDE